MMRATSAWVYDVAKPKTPTATAVPDTPMSSVMRRPNLSLTQPQKVLLTNCAAQNDADRMPAYTPTFYKQTKGGK